MMRWMDAVDGCSGWMRWMDAVDGCGGWMQWVDAVDGCGGSSAGFLSDVSNTAD